MVGHDAREVRNRGSGPGETRDADDLFPPERTEGDAIASIDAREPLELIAAKRLLRREKPLIPRSLG